MWPPFCLTTSCKHIVKLCRALSGDLCRKVVTNARVRLQEVVRQNGGHIEHVLHYEQFSSLWGLILFQMSHAFVIIKMCYVHNQWYDISCTTLYIKHHHKDYSFMGTEASNNLYALSSAWNIQVWCKDASFLLKVTVPLKLKHIWEFVIYNT